MVKHKSDRKSVSSKQEKESKVLLVCVYDTVIFQLTNALIYQKFNCFGQIVKVLIFEKNEMTKFFVEYLDLLSAIEAKNTLDGTKLCDNICKMNIYFSNFSYVDLKHQTTEGVDYDVGDSDWDSQSKKDLNTKSTSGDFFTMPDDEELMQTFAPLSPLGRSKTDDPRTLQHIIEGARFQMPPERGIAEEEEVEKQIKIDIDQLLLEEGSDWQSREEIYSRQSLGRSMESIGASRQHLGPISLGSIKSTMKLKDDTLLTNPVVCFDIINPLAIRHVYNIFSNFGNISVITLKRNKAFIKFRTQQFAAIASTYLNGYSLLGNLLALQTPPPLEQDPKENEYCECMYYDTSSDRFTAHRSITINPPSNTLHISSIKREICREKTLREIFSPFGDVERVKILQQSNEKNMALVKFTSIQSSFHAVSELHNQIFSGRKMQISFTKSKL